MQNKMIGFYVQKFDGDSTIVYSIEEDDQDILTMTASIGDTFCPKTFMTFLKKKSTQATLWLGECSGGGQMGG